MWNYCADNAWIRVNDELPEPNVYVNVRFANGQYSASCIRKDTGTWAFGLNMQQGGHYIVWFGTGWNLELYQQANARLHRQGQKYPVQVYKLICANTVDERADAALGNKKGVQQSLLDSLNFLVKKHKASIVIENE